MRIALIIGCARSGTSILGELLAAHEDVQYYYELHDLWERGGMGPNDSHRLTESAATPEVVAGIRGWFEERRNGRMIIEKCPRNSLRVPYLRAIFPEARFIHIVRDGRDTTCSLRPGIGGEEWRHLKPEDWQELRELPWLERCARVWLETVTLAEVEIADAPALTVRYEDLVRDPRTTAARLIKFLGLAPSPGVEEFCAKVQDSTDGGYLADNYSRKWNTADHARRIGRWRENLTADEQLRVNELLGPTLKRFGYEP